MHVSGFERPALSTYPGQGSFILSIGNIGPFSRNAGSFISRDDTFLPTRNIINKLCKFAIWKTFPVFFINIVRTITSGNIYVCMLAGSTLSIGVAVL